MAAPTVQQLSDIVASLNSVYDPQRESANQGINTVNTNTSQAETGINAAKDQAFTGITNTANAKGMLFSGFSPDQQAKYTAATFLPALVKLHAGANDNITKLQQTIMGLNSQQTNQAMGIQTDQKRDLNAYEIAQQQAEIERQKMEQQLAIAQQNNETKLQTASISANASRAAAQPNASQIKQADAAALAGQLQKVKGGDGYVSPNSYAAAKSTWVNAGYSSKEFDDIYSNLRNPKNKAYKVG